MGKKIIITGATGLIGKYITQVLSARGDEVTVFTRSPNSAKNELPGAKEFVQWDSYEKTGQWQRHIEGKDAILHLAGEPLLGALWSDDYKEKILKAGNWAPGLLYLPSAGWIISLKLLFQPRQ